MNSYALGPAGTNILKAAEHWHRAMSIARKASTVSCETPEQAIHYAKTRNNEGVLNVFWTCAVYFKQHELFFTNTDTLPFMFQITLALDEMQLACRPESVVSLRKDISGARVLSHPSPATLIRNLPVVIINALSNADAAIRCQRVEADACVTTETARSLYGLSTLHRFGAPPMIFFGGITGDGARLLRRCLRDESSTRIGMVKLMGQENCLGRL
ncbi:MAG TPA: hypothetical protein VE863_19720 [Pyrinomonadaceae bacterium]|nr:hypothetical protein [Pyrinomonadaceae bacterium]